ncbi:MAG: MFS transporter [Acetobacteraceae bacterium]
MTPPAIPARRTTPISLLAAAGFASGSGMRLLDPLLPALAHSLGVSVSGAAWVIAGFMLPYGVGQLAFGPLGDRLGKLRVICVALGLYGVAVVACAGAGGLAALVLLRAISGLFAGAVIPLAMAWIGDAVPYAERQVVIGRFLTGMVMAQLVTGPISGVIAERLGWRASFLVLGGVTIGVAMVLGWQLGASLWRSSGEAPGHSPGLHAYLGLLARPSGLWLLVSAFFDGACLFGGAFPFVGAYLVQDFGLSAGNAGLVVACFGLGAFVYTRFARRLLRRLGEPGLLTAGGIGLTVGLAALGVAMEWRDVALMQIMLGHTFYMFHGVLQARATEALPEARGTAVAAFAMALFLGQSTGSLAFGGLLAVTGYRRGFEVAAIGVLLLTAWARLSMQKAQ